MLVQLIFLLLTIRSTHGTRVIDSTEHDGVYVKEYCPKMKYCPEGTHTMCTFYDPRRVYSPKCANFQNISITPDEAEYILDMYNEMRGRIAMGKETGHGNHVLPRGYGIYKLKWDSELATFAQILANTCTIRFDLCRATKKFSDPGQAVGLIRFSIPDWMPLSGKHKLAEKGLHKSKIKYAIDEITKIWYEDKRHITVDMLKATPDWLKRKNTKGKNFLQIIGGSVTHVGCGISAYVEYHFLGLTSKSIIYNNIHLVCNFSAAPRSGTTVFSMTNKGKGCGCPDNYKVDDRCLCTDPFTKPVQNTCGKDKNCKPAVVLLPIFTAEDYVPPKNPLRESLNSMADNHLDDTMQTEQSGYKKTELYFGNSPALQSILSENLPSQIETAKREAGTGYIKQTIGPPYINERINLVEDALDNENNDINSPFSQNHWHPNDNKHWNPNSSPFSNNGRDSKSRSNSFDLRLDHTRRNVGTRKESIFSKSPKFEIPSTQNGIVKKEQPIKQDVAPRRDFSNIQSVLDNYLDEKKKDALTNPGLTATHKPVNTPKHEVPILNELLESKNIDIYKSLHMKSKFPDKNNEEHNITITQQNIENGLPVINVQEDEDSNKKLMTLLDTLEQEVKHIELDHNKKELFDKKIRKIYGSIVGKPESLSQAFANAKSTRKDNKSVKLESDTEHAITFDDVFEDPRSFEKDMFDTEDRINKLRTEVHGNPRPVLDHRQNNVYTKDMVRNHEGFSHNIMTSDEDFDSRLATNDLRKRKRLYKELNKDLILYEKGSSENNIEKVISVPHDRNLRNRKEITEPKIHLRSELEIDQPRIYKKQDFEKRAQVHTKQIYKTSNTPFKRRLNEFHDRKRDFRADDEKERKINSIDGPRIRYEEDIHADYIDGKHKTYYDDENVNDQHDFDSDKEYKDEPLLSEDRRNFYQKKLNELERKIQPERRFLSNHDMARERRLIRRQRMQQSLRPNRPPKESSRRRLYVPSRARSTHSFK